jgi:hypothetical protein
MNPTIVMLDAYMLAELHRLGVLGDARQFGHCYSTTRLACAEASKQTSHMLADRYVLDFQEAPLAVTLVQKKKLGCLLHEASVVAAFSTLSDARLVSRSPKGEEGVAWLIGEYEGAKRFPGHLLSALRIRWSVACALAPATLRAADARVG